MKIATSTIARKGRARTLEGDIARLAARSAASKAVGFGKYRGRRLAFHTEVLGYDPVEPQKLVLDALERSDRVAAPSGRAMGKSRLDGGEALYFAATEGPNACVVLVAPTFKQIQTILWEEIRSLYFNARVKFGGECAKLASTGLRLPDGSRIFGITGDQPEALQGIRAPRMMVIADEASGIPDTTFHALEGNLAGGGTMLLTGNPTKSSGYFRNACRNGRFEVVHLPSTMSPNVIAGESLVQGLATLEWIEERKQEWGEESPLYKIHVLGEFVEHQAGRVFTEEAIAAAHLRWADPSTPGRLIIGLDPAGDRGDGDESAFAVRNGKRVVYINGEHGLSATGHVDRIRELIKKHAPKANRARPLVVVDRDGYVGARVFAELNAYQSQHQHEFTLRGVRGGERARRPDIDRVRDAVWLNLLDAFRSGLAIPEDVKLERDLASIRIEQNVSGRTKIISKDTLRRELGRSPDRGDALALAAWGKDRYDDDFEQTQQHQPHAVSHERDSYTSGSEAISPYGAENVFSPWGNR